MPSISNNYTPLIVTFTDQYKFNELKKESIEINTELGSVILFPPSKLQQAKNMHAMLEKMEINVEKKKGEFVAQHIQGCDGYGVFLTKENLKKIKRIFARELSDSDKSELKMIQQRLNDTLQPPAMLPIIGLTHANDLRDDLRNLCNSITLFSQKEDATQLFQYGNGSNYSGIKEMEMPVAEYFYHKTKERPPSSCFCEDMTIYLDDFIWHNARAPEPTKAVEDALKFLRKIEKMDQRHTQKQEL